MIIFKKHISFASQRISGHHVFLVVCVRGIPRFSRVLFFESPFCEDVPCARRFQMNQVDIFSGERLGLEWWWNGGEGGWRIIPLDLASIDSWRL